MLKPNFKLLVAKCSSLCENEESVLEVTLGAVELKFFLFYKETCAPRGRYLRAKRDSRGCPVMF